MTELEDILRERYKILLDDERKKKPKGPKEEDYIIFSNFSNSTLFSEEERLRLKHLGLGTYLGQGGEEDEGLEDLGSSISLLSKYLIKPNKGYNLEEEVYKKEDFNFNLEEIYINKDILKKNYNPQKIFKKIFSKNFNFIQASPLGLNLTLGDSASITADNIGEFALPIVEYIHQTQPDYVVASDRGARLLGLAVFKLHNRLYGRFPTTDGTLRFRRFSRSNTQEATEKHLQPLVDEILQQTEYERVTGIGRLLPRKIKKKPTVLVLDDWVCSGGTKRLAQNVFDKLGKGRIKVKFGVLVGSGADVSGHSGQTSGFAGATDWRDDSNIIGVRYGKDYWGSTGIKAQPVRSEQARDYRIRMYEGIDKLAERISEEGKEAVLAK